MKHLHIHYSLEDLRTGSPLMQTWMELQIPINKINPTLEEIGHYYIQLLNNILDTHRYIIMWGQRGSTLKGSNYILLNVYHFMPILLLRFRGATKYRRISSNGL